MYLQHPLGEGQDVERKASIRKRNGDAARQDDWAVVQELCIVRIKGEYVGHQRAVHRYEDETVRIEALAHVGAKRDAVADVVDARQVGAVEPRHLVVVEPERVLPRDQERVLKRWSTAYTLMPSQRKCTRNRERLRTKTGEDTASVVPYYSRRHVCWT